VSLATTRVWVVEPGDTLWGIARQLQPSGDIRPLVDQLSRQLTGGQLQVGQRLIIP
jgi:LysM repeat protein